MRQIFSVWMAAAKPLLWKLLLLLAAMVGVEVMLFSGNLRSEPGFSFGMALQAAHGEHVYGTAVILLTVLLCLQGCQFSGGKLRYTLQRLPMGEVQVTAWWIVVHLGCYVILWAVQLASMLVQWRMYAEAANVQAPALQLFVECYLDGFVHSIMPLQDWTRWMRNIVLYGGLAVMTAFFGYFQRRGRFRIEPAVALVCGVGALRNGMQNAELDWMITGVMVVLLTILWSAVRGDMHEAD